MKAQTIRNNNKRGEHILTSIARRGEIAPWTPPLSSLLNLAEEDLLSLLLASLAEEVQVDKPSQPDLQNPKTGNCRHVVYMFKVCVYELSWSHPFDKLHMTHLSLLVVCLVICLFDRVSCITRTPTATCFRRNTISPLRQSAVVDDDGSKFEGQFIPLDNMMAIVPDGLPFGLAVAGFSIDELEEIIDNIFGSLITDKDGRLVRTVVLDERDKRVKLNDVLTDKTFLVRDHEIPEVHMKVVVPFILFSGFNQAEISGITKTFRKYFSKECIFAVAVAKALDKTFAQIYDEILGDYNVNKKGGKL